MPRNGPACAADIFPEALDNVFLNDESSARSEPKDSIWMLCPGLDLGPHLHATVTDVGVLVQRLVVVVRLRRGGSGRPKNKARKAKPKEYVGEYTLINLDASYKFSNIQKITCIIF